MTGNTRQVPQNIDAMYPIRFVSWGGRPIIFEYDRGVQRNQLTWPQSHGGNFYSEGDFLFTGRMDRHRVEALWPRQLGVDQSDRVTFSDVVRAYMNDEPDQCNVSVKIEQIEVYSGGGGRARLSNVVEIAEGTFVTFPRLNGRTAWWGYSALASEFALHRRASGMMSVLPWLRFAAQLGAMATGNVGGQIGEEVGGWFVKVVARQIRRFPVRLAAQLTRIQRQIQILVRNGSFVRSRPLIAGMRAWFVGFANGLSSRIAQHISQDRSDRRDVGARLSDIQGIVLWDMVEQSLRESATAAVVAGITEPVFAMVGRQIREHRMAGETNAVILSSPFEDLAETERQRVRRRLNELILDQVVEAVHQYVFRDILSAFVSIDLAGVSHGIESTRNRPAEAPSSNSASPERQDQAELQQRYRRAIERVPFFRFFIDGTSDPSGRALRVVGDVARGMLESFAELIQPNRPGGPLGL